MWMTFFMQGPVVGGFLARSASKYEATQISFFCKFPYVLPCLVGAALGILSLTGRWYSCGKSNAAVKMNYVSWNLMQLLAYSLPNLRNHMKLTPTKILWADTPIQLQMIAQKLTHWFKMSPRNWIEGAIQTCMVLQKWLLKWSRDDAVCHGVHTAEGTVLCERPSYLWWRNPNLGLSNWRRCSLYYKIGEYSCPSSSMGYTLLLLP